MFIKNHVILISDAQPFLRIIFRESFSAISKIMQTTKMFILFV